MMFIITYVPAEEGTGSNEQFEAAIKLVGNWANALAQSGTWIVASRLNAAQIRDQLKPFVQADKGDRLFVARISRNWAGTNMGSNFPDWLKRQEFGTFVDPNTSADS